MDFWFYVSPYISNMLTNSFDSHEVVWDYLLKMEIKSITNSNYLSIRCYPGYQDFKPTNDYIEDNSYAKLYEWNYVQCGANVNTYEIYLDYLNTSIFQFSLYPSNTSSLKIRAGKGSKTNYGYLFIQEVKLWSIINKESKSTRC